MRNTAKEMKKILFIVSSLKIGGGAEKSVALLAKGLIDQGLDIEILTFYKFKDEYDLDSRIKRHSFNQPYQNNIMLKASNLLVRFPLRLKSFLEKDKYDVVISNAEDANLVSLLTKKYLNSKMNLWVVVRNNILSQQNTYKRQVTLHKHADKIIVLTKTLQAELKKIFPNKEIHQIYNALDLQTINKLKKEKLERDESRLFKKNKIILSVGRLSEQKNYPFLIDCFKQVKVKEPDEVLVILGDGPLRSEIERKIQEEELTESVILLGVKENPYKYMARADIFVLASLFEGFPRVLLEATACGAVCIANNCPQGPSELLDESILQDLKRVKKAKYGYLVPYNDKKKFIKCISLALQEEKPYKEKALKRSEDFSLETISREWRNLIK